MSKEDRFSKKTDQTLDSSQWAVFVDRQQQPAQSRNSDGAERVEPTDTFNLTPQQLDDLELDRQLRMMAKVSSPEDPFVDNVIAQTQTQTQTQTQAESQSQSRAESQSQSQSNFVYEGRPRLPVVGPSLAARTSVGVDDQSDSVPQSSGAFVESSGAIAQVDSTKLIDEEITGPTVSLADQDAAVRRPVALFVLLATVLMVGFFLGGLWWSGSASDVADSENSKAGAGSHVEFKGIADSQDQSREDSIGLSPEIDVDHEALVKQTMDRDEIDYLAVTSKDVDLEDRNEVPKRAGDANSNSTLADAERKPTPAVASTEDGMAADEDNLEERRLAQYTSDDQSWNPNLHWDLAFRFDSRGVGSVTLNGQSVEAVVLRDNAVFLLRKIRGELQRRVRFLENRLGPEVRGSIAVNDSTYRFANLSELGETVEKVDQKIAELDVQGFSVHQLMSERVSYRERLFAQRSRLGLIHLAGENLRFCTEDEVFTICSVLSASEELLRRVAKKRLIWEKENEVQPTKSKLKNQIQPKDFFHFANNGALVPTSSVNFSDQSMTGIQNLGPLELQRMLRDAPSIDLFRDAHEFRRARDFVFSNGPPEMKQQLSVDKLDRLLNDRSIPIEANAREILEDRRTQARNKLSELLKLAVQGASNRDGALMEPLKAVLAGRADLQGLPLVTGKQCKSDAKETRELQQVSASLGRTIAVFNGSMGSRDVTQNDAFRYLSVKKMVSNALIEQASEPSAQKLKAIDQILQIDHPRLRLEVIGRLRKSDSDTALRLLVNKVKFDLEPEVRIAATAALAEIKPDNIRGLLLEGFTYPWHVVAEHSAEALVRLDDQDAVSQLIEMLDLPHPYAPFVHNGALVQRELVGINHLRNCLLCHAPSTSFFDPVRGNVPHTSMPLPKQYTELAGMIGGAVPLAVRADVTYLQQDFSVIQPVQNSGKWPSDQRFDYVVRKKKLTASEAQKVAAEIGRGPNRHRDAIIYALRQLTGETPADNSPATWKMLTAGRD